MSRPYLSESLFKAFLLSVCFLTLAAFRGTDPLRKVFFAAFSGTSEASIDRALETLKSHAGTDVSRAYQGALLMRKADFQKPPPKKLNMFKKGHRLLEGEITRQPDNAEFRFIRLCIQENAPKILKYRGDIETDRELVLHKFGALPEDLKNEIRKYAGSSEILDPGALK